VCPVCLGIPGSLPILNRKALEVAISVALALNCKLHKTVFFWRKNYAYPDMSKNFQISQFDRVGGVPIASNGNVAITVDHTRKDIRIRRVHLEEDPARLIYPSTIDSSPYTLVDYNRSGIALLEIVTDPDLDSPKEARIFLQRIRTILEYLEVSDGTLEGAMRCDANISIEGGSRVEIKNISSFKEVERAFHFEIIRQKGLARKGRTVKRETRHWDEKNRVTISLRGKEQEHDYRYFPEPDLTPINIQDSLIEKIQSTMTELPDARKNRLIQEYEIPNYDAEIIASDKHLADFFEKSARLYDDSKVVSNWLIGDFLRYLHEADLEVNQIKTTPEDLIELLELIDEGRITGKIAKPVLEEMISTGRSPTVIIQEKSLERISDLKILERLVDRVFDQNPKAVEDAIEDPNAVHYLVGQLMRLTKGMADPMISNKFVREKIDQIRESHSSDS
jgi:aspartyl-tRNA(Asn)/glutamyl-tRNA(Gln) amidotransferase subunit B